MPRSAHALLQGWPSTWTSCVLWLVVSFQKKDQSRHICSLTRLSFPLFLSPSFFPHKPLSTLLAESFLTGGSSSFFSPSITTRVLLRGHHQEVHPPLTPGFILCYPFSYSLFLFFFSSSTTGPVSLSLFPFVLHSFIRNLVPLVNRERPRACAWIEPGLVVPSRAVCMMNYESLSWTRLGSLACQGTAPMNEDMCDKSENPS